MQKEKYLIVLGGATASGKTSVGIQLAKALQTVILSGDSRQFYQEMAIGTAKPTLDELAQVPHHFVNSVSINDSYNIGDFERDGLAKLEEIFQKKDCALLVGGSGLYIKALCEGLDTFPDVPDSTRQEVETKYQEQGIQFLQNKIKEIDPNYAAKVDLNNPHRLIRAIAIYRSSGQTFSSFLRKQHTPRKFKVIYLCLHRNRKELYERINLRVDQMMEMGQLEEAKGLHSKKDLQALQTVGYQELFSFLDGKCSLAEAIELIKRNSRRYAKRQGTWFRKDPHWFFFAPHQISQVKNYLRLFMEEQFSIQRISVANKDNLDLFCQNNKITLLEQDSIRNIGCFQNQKLIGFVQINQQKNKNIIWNFSLLSDFKHQGLEELLMLQMIHHLEDRPSYGGISKEFGSLFSQHQFQPISKKDVLPPRLMDLKNSKITSNDDLVIYKRIVEPPNS